MPTIREFFCSACDEPGRVIEVFKYETGKNADGSFIYHPLYLCADCLAAYYHELVPSRTIHESQ